MTARPIIRVGLALILATTIVVAAWATTSCWWGNCLWNTTAPALDEGYPGTP
jgi:hypothetical protein